MIKQIRISPVVTTKNNYVLIDYENVQVQSLALLKEDNFHVLIFLGKTNTKLDKSLVIQIQQRGEKARYVELETSGKNALDFHIAYYIGQLSASDPTGFFHVISKDTGFDPLLQHLKSKKILAARSESIETMPCFEQPKTALIKQVPKPKEKTVTTPQTLDKQNQNKHYTEYLSVMIKRHPANPKTIAGLFNHMKSHLDKDMTNQTFQKLLQAFVQNGYIKLNEKKLTYTLPKRQ